MILKYKVVFVPKDPRYDYSEDIEKYDLVEDMPYCCSEMKDNSEYVSYNPDNGKLNLRFDEEWCDTPDWTDIEYCPWCGEKIIVEVVKRTKIIQKFKKKTITKNVCEFVGQEEVDCD